MARRNRRYSPKFRAAVAALTRALGSRDVQPGLLHHSDRGAQYTSVSYLERL